MKTHVVHLLAGAALAVGLAAPACAADWESVLGTATVTSDDHYRGIGRDNPNPVRQATLKLDREPGIRVPKPERDFDANATRSQFLLNVRYVDPGYNVRHYDMLGKSRQAIIECAVEADTKHPVRHSLLEAVAVQAPVLVVGIVIGALLL